VPELRIDQRLLVTRVPGAGACHQVRRTVVELADVEHLAHVLAAQPRVRPCLAQEPHDHLVVSGHLLVQHLDCDRLRELKVGRQRHHPHGALPRIRSIRSFPETVARRP